MLDKPIRNVIIAGAVLQVTPIIMVNQLMTTNYSKFRVAILTSSDAGSKGERDDTSGDAISEFIARHLFEEVARDLLPDEQNLIENKLAEWCDSGKVDLVLTTGGTGLGPRDVTPEATRKVIDFEVPGLTEAIRIKTMSLTPMAMLSRAVSGVRMGTLILNLPGSPKGVVECLEVAIEVLPHGLEVLKGRRGHPSH